LIDDRLKKANGILNILIPLNNDNSSLPFFQQFDIIGIKKFTTNWSTKKYFNRFWRIWCYV